METQISKLFAYSKASGGLGRAGPISYPKKSAQAGLGPYCILQKPAQAKMGQVKSGLGQNGPIFWQLLFQNGPILCYF